MLYIAALVVILWLLYKWMTTPYGNWEKRGFPFMPGRLPFGSIKGLGFPGTYMGHSLDIAYRKAGSHPYIGIYDARTPILVLRDPEVIQLVLTKEFSHFRDRNGFQFPETDILVQNLFFLDGEKWRALRIKLSPTFTSGKLKTMFPLFVTCAESLDSLLLSKLETTIDVKDVFARFETDIICSCAFGLEVNGINDEECEFLEIGNSFFKVRTSVLIMSFIFKTFPKLLEWIPGYFRLTPMKVENFIMNIVQETVKNREKNGIKRNDFLDLLMQLKEKGVLIEETVKEHEGNEEKIALTLDMTIELIAAQCFVFFLAGFETSSSVQTYCLYELALHPEIQEKLHDEIETVIAKHGGITYQAVQNMEYLDMVISETVRKYPTLPFLQRACSKDFTMPNGNVFKKGDKIVIPVWSLHHDPEYFPKPDTFDPERFSPENLPSIKPYTYLPFGEGPRMCIGMRFGQLQTKIGLITILRKYRVQPTEKTPIPLTFWGASVVSTSKEKVYLKLLKRSSD